MDPIPMPSGPLSNDRAELLRRLQAKERHPKRAIGNYPRETFNGIIRAPASWAQQRLWFIHQLEADARPIWHIQLCARLQGVLNRTALLKSLSSLEQRHETLRTYFASEHGELWQEITHEGRLKLSEIDLTALDESQRQLRLASHKASEAEQHFDLLRGPLIRGRLLRVSTEEHVLLITMHHLIADGWSLGVFIQDLAALYTAHHEERVHRLPSLPIQYADYAQWQREPARQSELDIVYWRARLAGAPPLLDLPTDRPRPERPSHRGRRATVLVDAPLLDALRAAAQRYEMSAFMVLHAAWVMLLAHLSGQHDVVIGTPVANRPRPEVEGLIGLFINTVALRAQLSADMSIGALLAQVRDVMLGAFEHQDTPFEKVVEALQPPRSLAHHPVFQVMVILQNAHDAVRLPDLSLKLEEGVNHHALFDVMLSLEERRERIVLDVDYAADLFDAQTIERWLACYVSLLREITADPSRSLADLFSLPDMAALPRRTRQGQDRITSPYAANIPACFYEAPHGPLEEALAAIWQDLLSIARIGRNDNFFDLEGHSLLALKLLFRIEQTFGLQLDVTDIYRHPTLQTLADCIREGQTAAQPTAACEYVDLSTEALLDPAIQGQAAQVANTSPGRILLTGATGFVGRFLLSELLRETSATIYCLVRSRSPQEARSRLEATLSKWELWQHEFARRIVTIPGDLRLPHLGLTAADYEHVRREVDTIYHCGTSMNHLETYAMAKAANVEGAREILKLACDVRPKSVQYVSTLGVFSMAGASPDRVVSETTPVEGERHPAAAGYLASKWVAEKIFMTGAERGIPCNIFRLGFVWADTDRGRYDELQREYRVFKSCLLCGFGIENYRYEMPATPVDYVARSVVALARRHHGGAGIFHISATETMNGGLFERSNRVAGTALKLLPEDEWVREIQRLHRHGSTLPVVPLLASAFATYDESIRFDCAYTHQELERAGVTAPRFNDAILQAFVHTLRFKDADLRARE